MITGDSVEWFRQARYDLGTAEALFGSERYPPVLFFCHLSLEKALKAHYVEKFNDIPEKTHSLVLLVELPDLELSSASHRFPSCHQQAWGHWPLST